jgi:hypothetical protein
MTDIVGAMAGALRLLILNGVIRRCDWVVGGFAVTALGTVGHIGGVLVGTGVANVAEISNRSDPSFNLECCFVP